MIRFLQSVTALLILAYVLAACASTGTAFASLKVQPDPDLPPLRATTLAEWEVEKVGLREQFETLMYGTWPEGLAVEFGQTRVVDENYLDGRGRLEETIIALGKPDADGRRRAFHLVVAYPKGVEGPMPIVIGQTFSQNCQVFLSDKVSARNGGTCDEDQLGFNGFGGWAIKTILGRYIAKAPIEQYFERGMAYANYYASSIVPDIGPMAGARRLTIWKPMGVLIRSGSGFSAIPGMVSLRF